MDIKQKVIDKFNEVFGADLKNLENIEEFHEKLESEKRLIEESLTMASSEAPSKVKAAVENVESIRAEFKKHIEESTILSKKINEVLEGDRKAAEVQKAVDKINDLERALSYLKILKCLEDISEEMETSLGTGDEESMITSYCNLVEVSRQLQSSSCHNLMHYLKEILHFWYNNLREKFSNEYLDVLKSLKWPFCGTNASGLVSPVPDTMTRFKILTEYLLQLQLPEETPRTVKSSLLADFSPVCLPVVLLVRPLGLRFKYHFTGSKQTNRRDKPEWFFTQILTWIKDHARWTERNVQPVADATGFHHVNTKIEFMRALVQLAVEKLQSELLVVQYDDALFAHLVDEALGFERELRETLSYPQSQPATVFVLTQAQIFVKWINMERKYAIEKIENILGSSTAWERVNLEDSDEMKITESADAFLTLLTTISDRYNHLPQPGHRLQFLELQLELIDDWRVRLLQLLHDDREDPLESLIPRILNSIRYVARVLMEWGVTVHFLQLHFFKKQCDAAELATDQGTEVSEVSGDDGTVFDEAVALLDRLENKLMSEICQSVVLDVKAKSRPYRTDKWFAMQNKKEVVSLSVTPSGCPMFQELASGLHKLHQILALELFNTAWKNLAGQLDQYLFEEIVLVNRFNVGGAEQLQFDVTRNLFPLFGLYTNKPESYFPLMREACILLNTLLGSALLLMETLENQDETRCSEALAELGVHKMNLENALMVLATRTDISDVSGQ
ncbi:RAD50-interacting protein 1 [Fopius arisanus]|uniref:RAD50-interacting protein 1 n=1 Tax=Fopius arisanus TaxID=64838 RepID=A0A9R1SZN7_9HYME|nr:PREDICTED: RAD50-interacting protein 1 [Fopius arisanus]